MKNGRADSSARRAGARPRLFISYPDDTGAYITASLTLTPRQ